MRPTNARLDGSFGRRELFRLGSTLVLGAGVALRPVLRASSGQAGLPERVRGGARVGVRCVRHGRRLAIEHRT